MNPNHDGQPDEDVDDLLTLQVVAELLRVPEATLRYWRHRHVGPDSFKIGRHVRYLRREVQRWLRCQRGNRGTDGA